MVAFNDRFSAQGDFFLGCGTIRDQSCYFYYIENPSGEISMEHVSTDYATILEQDRSDGILRTTRYIHPAKKSFWFVCAASQKTPTRQFIVPKGTVKRSFAADLN